MTGFFDYRTSSNPNFGTPGYRDLEMKGGKIYEIKMFIILLAQPRER